LIFDRCYQISNATAANAVSTYVMDAEAVYVHEAVTAVSSYVMEAEAVYVH
jgi:hypothetical protein